MNPFRSDDMFDPAFPVWRFNVRAEEPLAEVLSRLGSALDERSPGRRRLSGEVSGSSVEARLSERPDMTSPTLSISIQKDDAGTAIKGWFLLPALFPFAIFMVVSFGVVTAFAGEWVMALGPLGVFVILVLLARWKIKKIGRVVRAVLDECPSEPG
jgi:hypothetical protein